MQVPFVQTRTGSVSRDLIQQTPPKTRETEAQHGQNDEGVEGKRGEVLREASGSHILDCHSRDPLKSFTFLHSDNNTGQMKSASQNN